MGNFEVTFSALIGAMIGFAIGVMSGAAIMENDNQEKAIEAQCAGYNAQTGEFEWFKPLDKERNK